jgi:hypothetical protein
MSKTPTKPRKKLSADAYNAVVDTAELLDVKMIKSSFDVQPAFFGEPEDSLELRFDCDLAHSTFDSESKRLIAIFQCEAGAKKSRSWLLRAKFSYLVAYAVSGEPTPESAQAYMARVGRFTCYPYFRAHFASLCGQAGASMPPLPVLRDTPLPRTIGVSEPRNVTPD